MRSHVYHQWTASPDETMSAYGAFGTLGQNADALTPATPFPGMTGGPLRIITERERGYDLRRQCVAKQRIDKLMVVRRR